MHCILQRFHLAQTQLTGNVSRGVLSWVHLGHMELHEKILNACHSCVQLDNTGPTAACNFLWKLCRLLQTPLQWASSPPQSGWALQSRSWVSWARRYRKLHTSD